MPSVRALARRVKVHHNTVSEAYQEQGTPLRVAQAQLGHSHMTTTLEVYTHASASAQRQAVDQLENQLFPNLAKSNKGRISK